MNHQAASIVNSGKVEILVREIEESAIMKFIAIEVQPKVSAISEQVVCR
jgi:hypothetical protein